MNDRDWLSALLRSPADVAPRLRYAENLASRGESLRAEIVRRTCQSLRSASDPGLPALLQERPPEHAGWARWLGARLIAEMEARALSGYVPRWMAHALPALSGSISRSNDEPALGSSYFWGDPDLPEGFEWPTYRDCARFFGDAPELDPASKCHFLGQLNLADLALCPGESALPTTGLVSIFALDVVRDVDGLGRETRSPRPPRDRTAGARLIAFGRIRRWLWTLASFTARRLKHVSGSHGATTQEWGRRVSCS